MRWLCSLIAVVPLLVARPWTLGEEYWATVIHGTFQDLRVWRNGGKPFVGFIRDDFGRVDEALSPFPLFKDMRVRCRVFHVDDPSIVIGF